jgi:hypothetical protein
LRASSINSIFDFSHRAIMSTPSLAPFILKRPWLQRWMKPLSEWYLDNAGYRKLGLRYVLTFFLRGVGNFGKRIWSIG